MNSFEGKRNAASIMKSATSTLALYALIVVVAEAGLGVAAFQLKDSPLPQVIIIIGMILILVLVVALAGWRYTSPREALPSEISSLWTEDDLPITKEYAQSLIERWNCQWTYRTPTGELAPYVDDTIVIEDVEDKTGKISGRGLSAYGPDANYKVFGRVSKRGLMHLFYSTPPPKMGLSGMVILRIMPIGDLKGWWLGTGREGGDVGGFISWKRAKADQEFQRKVYPVEK